MKKYISTKKQGGKNYLVSLGRPALILFFGGILYFSILILFYQSQKTERLRADLNLKTISGFVISGQQDVVESAHDYLNTLSFVPDVAGENNSACHDILSKLLRGQSFFVNFGVADEYGNIFCSGLPTKEILNTSDQEWFRVTKKTGLFSVGEYQVERITGKPSVRFGFPIVENGRVVRVLFADIGLDAVDILLRHPKLPEGASVLLVDKQGVILSRFPYHETYRGTSIFDSKLSFLFEERLEGVQELEDLDGVKRRMSFYPIYYHNNTNVYMGTIFYGIPAVAPALAKSVFGLIGAITSLIILFVLAFPKRLRKSV